MSIEEALSEVVREVLNEFKGRVETLIFVNEVMSRLRNRGFEINEELEATLRPRVVDILWNMSKKGELIFEEDLLHFVKK